MSQEHTISAVSTQTRDYGVGAKAKRVYYVKLEGAEPKEGVQAFELHKLQTSKPPAVGHKLDVKTFQEGDFNGAPFVKIIQDYKDRPTEGAGGSGGRDDATGESIERQVAAKAAAEMAIAAAGDAPTMVANFEAMFDAVIAKIHPPVSAPGLAQEVPADTNGLEPQSQVADESIPF